MLIQPTQKIVRPIFCVRRLHDLLTFVPTEPAWWTASAGHLLGEKEKEAAMNRFPGPLLAGVVPDYNALL
jgi:hypothetical protein